jgi:hypothetical protein
MTLLDVIKSVLDDPDSPVSTGELADLVVERIPPEELRSALTQAVRSVIMQQRSRVNKNLLRPASRDGENRLEPATPPSASVTPGGMRYASARTAALGDTLLRTTITGLGGRAVRLEQAGVPDLRVEIDINRRRGDTFQARANIYDDMLHEMAGLQIRRASELPSASRDKYALRLQELHF